VTFSPQLLNHGVKAIFVDGTDAFGRQLQGDPPVLFGQEIAFGLQIRQEPALGLDIGVRYRMSAYRYFPGDLTNS